MFASLRFANSSSYLEEEMEMMYVWGNPGSDPVPLKSALIVMILFCLLYGYIKTRRIKTKIKNAG